MIRFLLNCTALAATLMSSACTLPSYFQGREDAQREVDAGALVYGRVGLPAENIQDFDALLVDRYGIEGRQMAGCMVTDEKIAYVDGFNDVMSAAIKEKHGRDVVREAWDEFRVSE